MLSQGRHPPNIFGRGLKNRVSIAKKFRHATNLSYSIYLYSIYLYIISLVISTYQLTGHNDESSPADQTIAKAVSQLTEIPPSLILLKVAQDQSSTSTSNQPFPRTEGD